jgi:hypothetical protein
MFVQDYPIKANYSQYNLWGKMRGGRSAWRIDEISPGFAIGIVVFLTLLLTDAVLAAIHRLEDDGS